MDAAEVKFKREVRDGLRAHRREVREWVKAHERSRQLAARVKEEQPEVEPWFDDKERDL